MPGEDFGRGAAGEARRSRVVDGSLDNWEKVHPLIGVELVRRQKGAETMKELFVDDLDRAVRSRVVRRGEVVLTRKAVSKLLHDEIQKVGTAVGDPMRDGTEAGEPPKERVDGDMGRTLGGRD